jgi:hypothetical protein
MPAESEAQRKWAFGAKGAAWAKKHHFDNKGKLPEHVGSTDPKVHRRMLEARTSKRLKKAFSKD